jgi:hypothetical protein
LRQPLLGTSGAIAKTINGNPEIMELDFYQPIIVPLALKILVIVGKQMDYTNYTSASFISWYTGDRGESWYKGCNENRLVTTTDLTIPLMLILYYGKRKFQIQKSRFNRITTCDVCKTDMLAQ